ncbi:triphosphoribosyl-dephospho-CoA synthase CitG [Candidatus Enterococcus mansonii]|uniref:Probable 2-(5''-triphosphoribosyl)-3'-dephosphocoenzyme-A synthase n=1 Tax=Candidatus Enterococcus mansonii TaxID=1834181 RepID=A0A242C6L5_9ENTE|nr:triphosphoribosyl-dephospho-CoA synthase CitG [Enterococcus sp. 4G2_DIV0659]OTO05550.1 triphosphoribosyl-dephospho-CoA synthase CitG [Enterococcus sp. 4G2_DIV0659]
MTQANKHAVQPQIISALALQSLVFEASLSPKPGLVDPKSSGAHFDMTYFTFIDSSAALAPFLTEYVSIGMTHKGSPSDLFSKIRNLGQQAEKTMLTATKGINTHKGANFSFALLLSATGKIIQDHHLSLPFSEKETTAIFTYVKDMTKGLLSKDFANLAQKERLSYGEKLYLEHGIIGIRGEAEAGYPTLQKIALPFLRSHQKNEQHQTFLLLLLHLMAKIEDSNLINRGGVNAWKKVQNQANELLETFSINSSINELEQALTCFDQELTKAHLSPGGAADLLALSYFFAQLEHLW